MSKVITPEEKKKKEEKSSSNNNNKDASDFIFDDDDDDLIQTLAFGSCHKNKYADPHLWETILMRSAGATMADEDDKRTTPAPDAFLWTGDAIYPKQVQRRDIATSQELEDEYQILLSSDGYKNFSNQMKYGIFGIWDDHDYGGNDMGHNMPEKEERANLYWKFLQMSSAGNKQRKRQRRPENRNGLYYSVEWRRRKNRNINAFPQQSVKVIFLDTRWHRRDHCLIPSVAGHIPIFGAGIACLTRWLTAGLFPEYCRRSRHQSDDNALLGKEQWEWLEQQLLQQTGSSDNDDRVLIVVSSIQVLTTNPAMESWGHFEEERDRLVRLLSRQSGGGAVLLLSGDVHHGEILDPFPGMSTTTRPFLEITSSGLTHDCSQSRLYGVACRPLLEWFHRHRYLSKSNYYIGRNYGTVNIDWNNHTVTVQVHDAHNGSVMLSTGPISTRTSTTLPPPPQTTTGAGPLPCMDGHLRKPLFMVFTTMVVLFLIGKRMAPTGADRQRRRR